MLKRLVIGWLALSRLALYGQMEVGGFLKSYAAANPNHTDRWERLYSQVQWRFNGNIGERIAYRAEFVARYRMLAERGALAERGSGLTFYPAEWYIDYYGNFFDLRVGQQYVFWGRADWVNPTDLFVPWDYQNMSSDLEDYRIPIPAIKLDFYPSLGTLELVFSPVNVPDKIPFPYAPEVSDSAFAHSQWGLRFARDLGRIGYSFCYYQGLRKFPEFDHMQPPINIMKPVFVYRPIKMLGADFVWPGEHWDLKGEAALNISDDQDGTDPLVKNSNLYAVLGGDWLPNDRFSFNLQGIVRHYLQYDQDAEQARLDSLGATHVLTAYPVDSYSWSTVTRWKLGGFTEIQIIGVYNQNDGDWFLLPFVTREIAVATHLTLGAILFDGPAGSPFGASADDDQIFMELRVAF